VLVKTARKGYTGGPQPQLFVFRYPVPLVFEIGSLAGEPAEISNPKRFRGHTDTTSWFRWQALAPEP
jgi:hypothetical protein